MASSSEPQPQPNKTMIAGDYLLIAGGRDGFFKISDIINYASNADSTPKRAHYTFTVSVFGNSRHVDVYTDPFESDVIIELAHRKSQPKPQPKLQPESNANQNISDLVQSLIKEMINVASQQN